MSKRTFINYPKVQKVIEKFGLNVKSQKHEVTFGRYTVWNWLNQNGATLTKAGSLFPGRKHETVKDHASVINGIRRYNEMLNDKQWNDFNFLRVQIEDELRDCLDTTESKKFVSLTELEKEILNCKNMVELTAIKERIICMV